MNNIKEIKEQFISQYKHPYIDRNLYHNLLTDQQLFFYVQIFNEVENKHVYNTLFDSLLHIQCSIDIHDQIDIRFNANMADELLEENQLKILVGDFHSAMFYKLLTKNDQLNALYHFIQTIKDINKSKMSLIHYHDLEQKDISKQFNNLELIIVGLYDSLATFLNIHDYEAKWKPLILYYLLYSRSDLFWSNLIKNLSDDHYKEFEVRKNRLTDQIDHHLIPEILR